MINAIITRVRQIKDNFMGSTTKDPVRDYELYETVKLIPDISDTEIKEMLNTMNPVVFLDGDNEAATHGAGLYVVDVLDVDFRKVAYTWDPTILRQARLAYGNGWDAEIMTFHKFGAPSYFKPSLAETLACIRKTMPDGWKRVKFFWLDSRNLDCSNVISSYHYCRCKLFGGEFPLESWNV